MTIQFDSARYADLASASKRDGKFPFDDVLPTPKEHTEGRNTCEYIVVHHTGTKENTYKGCLDGLSKRDDFASCHFLIGEDGRSAKIGNPTDILWHVGESRWGDRTDMNRYAMGIEIVGPLSDGGFTAKQRATVKALIEHLMRSFGVKRENVIKHADCTWEGSKDRKLWDWTSTSRKTDVARSFTLPWDNSWGNFQKSLNP